MRENILAEIKTAGDRQIQGRALVVIDAARNANATTAVVYAAAIMIDRRCFNISTPVDRWT